MFPAALPLFGFLFGTPAAALAAAAGAVAVPVIIHLLNRRRFKIVTWAAMRFLLAAQRKNSRKMRLEQLVLLALRCLLVLLLVLAMASVMPWAESLWRRLFPESVSLMAAGSRRTHKVVVVDGSLSMAARQGDATAFDRARALAERIVRDSPRGDGFSVVLMSAPPRRIVPEPSEDPGKVAREIQALHLPHGNADLPATLITVESLLRQSPEKFAEREVYFVTDLQRGTWVLKQPGLVASALQKIQSRARTVFVDVGQDGLANVAVTHLGLAAPLATVGMTMPVSVTLHNFGPEAREGARLELWVGKAQTTAAETPLEMRLAHQSAVRINRGPNAFTLPYKFTSPGEYVLQVRTDADVLDLDDTRSAVLTVKTSVPVLLVDGKSGEREAFDRAAEWLRLALNPFEGSAVPGFVPFRTKVLTEPQFADAGLGDLTGYDAVFFADVARLSGAEVRRLETHVRRGGGVVFGCGPQVDLGSYNETLFRGGQGLLPARLLSRQETPRDVAYHFGIDGAAYQEPPLDAFGEETDRLSLLSARFRQYLRAAPAEKSSPRRILSFIPEAAPAKPADRPADPARPPLPSGDPALLVWQPPLVPAAPDTDTPPDRAAPAPARGRVALFTSTFNTDWNTWPASPSYPAFVQELARLMVAGRLREQAVLVGEPIEEYLTTMGSALDAVVTLPDGRAETVRTSSQEDANLLRWPDTDQSGVYKALIGAHPQEHFFAVNVPSSTLAEQSSESDLARTGPDELRTTYPEWEFQTVTELAQVVHTGGPTPGPDLVPRALGPVLAHWILLSVLVFALLEVVLAWRFGHHSGLPATEAPPRAGRGLVALGIGLAAVTVMLIGGVLLHEAVTGDFLGFLPGGLRRQVEAAFGVPPPSAGEGTYWRLEFLPYLGDAATDPWMAAGLAIAAALVVAWVYRQEGRTAGMALKFLLVALRFGVLLVLLAVFLPQLRLWFERQGWPDVAIIVDDSFSMSTPDRYQDPQVQAAADKLARDAGLTAPDRLKLAQALLARPDADWLTALLTRRQAKLHLYRCAGRAARIADVTETSQVDAALKAVRELQASPTHDSSQLGAAVRQVLNDFRGSSLAAVVMLTDGVTTEGEDLVKVSRYADQVGVPLFFVGLGDALEARDVLLHDLQVEETVYVNDRLVFEARVTGHGMSDTTVPVELYEKGKKDPIKRETVRLDPQGKPVKVRIVHQPKEEGEKVFVIRVPVQEGEATGDNNVIERAVQVKKAKLIKVLYVEGEPRWEFRYVKSLLERESGREEGNKSIDLKVVLLSADPEWPAQDKSALTEIPAKAELNQYDVILLGDVDPRPGPRTPRMAEHLQHIADFVKERGGGLLMLAGPKYAPHAYRGTPLQDVLPVDILEARAPAEPANGLSEPYRPELTAAGQMHPIFRFSPDEKENLEVWNGLKELFWWSEGYQPKRAAEVLAVHPRLRRGADGRTARADNAGPEGHPLVIQQFVGSGRSLFFGFEETWRWRWRDDELRFNQFWVQTVRYLARSRTGRVEIRLDKQTPYRRGEPIRITVRFPEDAPPPAADTDVKVVLERKPLGGKPGDTEVQTLQMAKVEGSRSTFEGLLTRTPEGEYQFWLSSPVVPGVRPRAECLVKAPPGELEVRRMNRADMERAAEKTQGRFYTLTDADRLPQDLPAGGRASLSSAGPPLLLWNTWPLFGLVLSMLTVEWVLRKRKHLL